MTMPRKEYPYVFEQTFTYTHSRGQAQGTGKTIWNKRFEILAVFFSLPALIHGHKNGNGTSIPAPTVFPVTNAAALKTGNRPASQNDDLVDRRAAGCGKDSVWGTETSSDSMVNSCSKKVPMEIASN